jgi:hypothetical protein
VGNGGNISLAFCCEATAMIRTHHQQPTLWTGFLKEEVSDLWEPWMRAADQILDDEQLIEQVFEAQGRRWKKSRTRGRWADAFRSGSSAFDFEARSQLELPDTGAGSARQLVYRAFARIGG